LFAGREYDDSSKNRRVCDDDRRFQKDQVDWIVVAITLTGGSGFAQNANTGEIKGTVTDNSGAIVRE
jgi:hypothetical protein